MFIQSVYKGSAVKVVHVVAIHDGETDAEVKAFAMAGVGETPSSVFGTRIERMFPHLATVEIFIG